MIDPYDPEELVDDIGEIYFDEDFDYELERQKILQRLNGL